MKIIVEKFEKNTFPKVFSLNLLVKDKKTTIQTDLINSFEGNVFLEIYERKNKNIKIYECSVFKTKIRSRTVEVASLPFKNLIVSSGKIIRVKVFISDESLINTELFKDVITNYIFKCLKYNLKVKNYKLYKIQCLKFLINNSKYYIFNNIEENEIFCKHNELKNLIYKTIKSIDKNLYLDLLRR